MNRLITILSLIVCGIFCIHTTILADNIPTKGKWGVEDARSIVPAPPVASVDGTNLTIEFVNPLNNLTIQIKDNSGAVVYEENISVSTSQSYTIPLSLQSGEYSLSFTHKYGFLTGSFVIK